MSRACDLLRDACTASTEPAFRSALKALAALSSDAWGHGFDSAVPRDEGETLLRVFFLALERRDNDAAKAAIESLVSASACDEWVDALTSAVDASISDLLVSVVFSRIGLVDECTDAAADPPSAGPAASGNSSVPKAHFSSMTMAPRAVASNRSFGPVTYATTRDAEQSRTGSLSAVGTTRPLPTQSPPASSGPDWLFTAPSAVAPVRRAGPLPVDEVRALRGLLFWAAQISPRTRSVIEAAVWSVLRSPVSSATKKGAVRAALELGASFAWEHSVFSPGDDAGAMKLLAALSPMLCASSGVAIEDSWSSISTLIARTAAPSQSALANATKVLNSLAMRALGESSGLAVLLLSQLSVLVAASPESLIESALPVLTASLNSDNSHVAQTARAWFKEPSLTCAVASSPRVLPAVLAALLRCGAGRIAGAANKHWNPSVNRATHTVVDLFKEEVLRLRGDWNGLVAYVLGPGADENSLSLFVASLVPQTAPHSTSAVAARTAVLNAAAQTIPTPLSFHDLIFGNELGRGAFACVRYAKVITRGSLPSTWPEVAVKVLPSSTLKSCSYARAAAREVTIMSLLSHPSCVRLLGAFRWRGAALLALELASGGDLHDHLIRNGALDEEAARFFTGELTVALAHLHSLGFAFGDVKPENVVIVPPPISGAKGIGSHVKLTDFAASRPINELGRRALANRQELLATLPDGDWRTQAAGGGVGGSAIAVVEGGEDTINVEDSGFDDERFEGTDEYQAPEVAAASGAPSIAGDSWALGLTVFQLLSGGRLPEARQDRKRAGEGVHFESSAGGDWLDFPPGVSLVARDFIRSLLHPDPSQRLGANGFEHIQAHEWLRSLGDASLLHACAEGPSIAATDASSAPPNARWARRHASTLWSPLPQAQPIKAANTPSTPNGNKHEWTLHELAQSQHLPVQCGDFRRLAPEEGGDKRSGR